MPIHLTISYWFYTKLDYVAYKYENQYFSYFRLPDEIDESAFEIFRYKEDWRYHAENWRPWTNKIFPNGILDKHRILYL